MPRAYRAYIQRLNARDTPRKNPRFKNQPPKNTEKKNINSEFEFGRYQFQIGDLVRRYQVGEPEQMFMYDVKNLGVITRTTFGRYAEVHVYWQQSESMSQYSVYAAEKVLQLISRADKDEDKL